LIVCLESVIKKSHLRVAFLLAQHLLKQVIAAINFLIAVF